jgi:hypothetical protein
VARRPVTLRWGRCGTLYEVVADPLWGQRPRLMLRWPPNCLVILAWALGVDHKRFWPPAPPAGWYHEYGRRDGSGQ